MTGSSARTAHARPTFGSRVATRGPEARTILPSVPSSLPTGFPSAQTTGALTGVDQTGGVVELDFDKSISDGVNIRAKRDGDAEIGLFSDEVVVNCEPKFPHAGK